MATTARGRSPEPDAPKRTTLDYLRSLAIGAALYSKGPRTFRVTVRPDGILIRATDRSLASVLTHSMLVPFDRFAEINDDIMLKAWLAEIDAGMDREIARAH